jgi:hypothetical protein
VQTISVFPAVLSQWALQYLDLSLGTQEHAGFAHFLVSAIVSPFSVRWIRQGQCGHGEYDAVSLAKDGMSASGGGRGFPLIAESTGWLQSEEIKSLRRGGKRGQGRTVTKVPGVLGSDAAQEISKFAAGILPL